MKKTVLLAILVAIIFGLLFVKYEDYFVGVKIGRDNIGYVRLHGQWVTYGENKDEKIITYTNNENASIFEMRTFSDIRDAVEKKESYSDEEKEKEIKRKANEFIENYIGMLGKSKGLRINQGNFAGKDAVVFTSEYEEPTVKERFLLKCWIFAGDDGNLRYVMLESKDRNFDKEEKEVINTFRFEK